MASAQANTSSQDGSKTSREGHASRNGADEGFKSISQQVQNLDINENEAKNDDSGELGEGEEKVIEVVESLCMNCQEDVGHHD